jgi:hypothetical protein
VTVPVHVDPHLVDAVVALCRQATEADARRRRLMTVGTPQALSDASHASGYVAGVAAAAAVLLDIDEALAGRVLLFSAASSAPVLPLEVAPC